MAKHSKESWHPDVLGEGFEQRKLSIPNKGKPVGGHATLVRATDTLSGFDGEPTRVAVLYVHGFSDYFFQQHLAEAVGDAGAAFYAVDLRGFGRSSKSHLDAGGDIGHLPDLAMHAADLDAATAAVRAAGHRQVIVMGHSMGGLVAARWAAARHASPGPMPVDGLILNSPWFELNENALLRGPITRIVQGLSPLAPRVIVGGLHPYYARALHKDTGGEWDYDLNWKPLGGFPVRAKWFASVRRAQAELNAGIDVGVPTLVLSSDRSGSHICDHPDVLTTDSVLSVAQIREGANHIGPLVEYVQVPGGAHDLALSPKPAREEYLRIVRDWLRENFELD